MRVDNDEMTTVAEFARSCPKRIDQPYTGPFINRGFNTRGQYPLTRNNTLNFNWNYNSRTQTNFGLNEFTLPERGADNKSRATRSDS